MSFLRVLTHAYLYIPFGIQRLLEKGAFGKDAACFTPSPVAPDDNDLKKALFRHYVRQYHEFSCSVASVTTVINALRTGKNESPPPIAQMEILNRVRIGHWKARMSEKGYSGRHGLPLALLGEIIKTGLELYGVTLTAVETVHADKRPDKAKKIKETLQNRLIEFESKGNCLIIAHFNQGVYVPALALPHISPVGGFNRRTDRVTLLDVDPTQPAPYQVGFDVFYKGLASSFNPICTHFGYKGGGYVFVRL